MINEVQLSGFQQQHMSYSKTSLVINQQEASSPRQSSLPSILLLFDFVATFFLSCSHFLKMQFEKRLHKSFDEATSRAKRERRRTRRRRHCVWGASSVHLAKRFHHDWIGCRRACTRFTATPFIDCPNAALALISSSFSGKKSFFCLYLRTRRNQVFVQLYCVRPRTNKSGLFFLLFLLFKLIQIYRLGQVDLNQMVLDAESLSPLFLFV